MGDAIDAFPDSHELEQWGRVLADIVSPEHAARQAALLDDAVEAEVADEHGFERVPGSEAQSRALGTELAPGDEHEDDSGEDSTTSPESDDDAAAEAGAKKADSQPDGGYP